MTAGVTDSTTDDDVRRFETELSNWGRWGTDDQLGALNFITAERRVSAAKLAATGTVVPLALPLTPGAEGSVILHHMLETGGDPKAHSSLDYIGIACHGQAVTHVDALCHIFSRGKMYNGYPASDVTSKGAASNSIAGVVGKIVGRGVILDIPAYSVSKRWMRVKRSTPTI